MSEQQEPCGAHGRHWDRTCPACLGAFQTAFKAAYPKSVLQNDRARINAFKAGWYSRDDLPQPAGRQEPGVRADPRPALSALLYAVTTASVSGSERATAEDKSETGCAYEVAERAIVALANVKTAPGPGELSQPAVQADARNAARYRWLREQVKTKEGVVAAQALFWTYSSRGELDKAIDAAMAGESRPSKGEGT